MKNHLTVFKGMIGAILISLLMLNGISAQDVGIASFVSPGTSTPAGSANVIIRLQNYDTVAVSSISVNWTVNGIVQAPVEYTRTLNPGATDTFSIGRVTLTTAAQFVINATTINPTDSNAANNSASRTVFVPLSGNYTIGGSSPSYARITNAISALTTYGVSGAVTFKLRPQTDTVRFTIPAITGASSSNTITFQSENNDSSSVSLRFPSTDTLNSPNAVATLDGADYIYFRRITLERTGNRAYGRVIDFKNSACFNSILNCRLIGSTQMMSGNSLCAILYSSAGTPTNDSGLTVSYNRFENGSIGIYISGVSTASPESGVQITNNIFSNQLNEGIDATCQANLILSGNTISSGLLWAGSSGIKLDRSIREHRISKNKISGYFTKGISMVDCSGINTRPGIVSNNFVQATDSFGIKMVNGYYQDFMYNSVNMIGGSFNSTAWEIGGIGTTNRIMNNVFANFASGAASRLNSTGTCGILICRNNDLYTTGSTIGVCNSQPVSDMVSWQQLSSRDSNSVNVDPGFTSSSDLHATARALNSAAIPVTTITDDIDGTTRNSLSPDIGADEFTPNFRDVTVTSILNPRNNTCGSDTAKISAIISNPGTQTETGFYVYAKSASMTTPISTLYTGQLVVGGTDTVYFNTPVSTISGGMITFTVYTANPIDDNHANDTLRVTRSILTPPTAPTTTGGGVCSSGSVNLNAVGGGSITWYSAATGGSVVGSGNTFTTPSISATTNYYASTTVSGCESQRAMATATVNAPPSVILGNDTSVTQGASVTFNAGAGYSSYSWSTGATTPSISVTLDGCYSVTVTDANGCTGTDQICIQTVQNTDLAVTAILSPISGHCGEPNAPVIVRIQNYGPFPANNIALNATISGAANGTLNGFFAGPLNVGDTATVTIGTVNTTNGGVVSVSAGTNYGVDNNHTNDILTLSINTIAEPALPFAGNAYSCSVGSVQLTAASQQNILWFDAATNGNLVGAGTTYQTPILAQSATYYAQAGNVCIGQNRTPVTASIYTPPAVTAASSNGITCVQNSSTLTATAVASGNSTISTYSWSPGGQTTPSITTGAGGTYTVTVTQNNGCTSTASVSVPTNTTSPTVNLGPNVSASNPPYQLSAPAGFTSYLWSSGQTTPTIQVNSTGTYLVTVTDQYGCTGVGSVFVEFTTGTEEIGPLSGLSIYPNPNQGRFNLRGTANLKGELYVRVNDVRGSLISTETIPMTGGQVNQEFDLSKLSKGIYTLTVSGDRYNRHFRFVIN